jgi:F0F1-type ATP synthase epsilon subunit
MAQMLKVRVNSPEKIIWEGEAEWVSSQNSQGPFDILPMHANFVSIIENQPIRMKTAQKVEEYKFDHSVIYAHDNQVYIYTNI